MNKNKLPEVCYYCSSMSFGGLEMNIVRILVWLREAGYTVQLMAPEKSPIEAYAQEEGVPVTTISVNKKYFDFKKAKEVGRRLKKDQVKLLFVGATRDVAFGTLIKRLYHRELKLIYHSQMQIGIPKKGLIHTLRYKMLDKWIVPLPYLKTEVGERTHFPVSKVEVIPLCVDAGYFSGFKLSKKEACKQLQLPVNKKWIGILGRIDPLKRQDFLIKVVYHLRQKGLDVGLVIMGEPTKNTSDDYLASLKKLITDFNLEEEVHFLPFSKETRPFFKAIDLFAMTTRGETFGMVTVEAMANGVPVAACNSGGSIEILDQGKLGVLFKLDSVDDFCRKAMDLLEDEAALEQKRLQALHVVAEKYDKKVQVQSFAAIIEQSIKETR